MSLAPTSLRIFLLATFSLVAVDQHVRADDFDKVIKPLLTDKCVKCHGGESKVRGKLNLKEMLSAEQFRAKPELVQKLIQAIDTDAMPPEDAPQLEKSDRAKLLVSLKGLLGEAARATTKLPPMRLNRYQYNNAIRDLFDLKKDIFPLTEKLMTRHTNYLQSGKGMMPDSVQVSSDYLTKLGGFENVQSYPKDLRATHGFDNQANQLTLSPLLLEAYIKLSLSIMESPDFKPQNVGIWESFFAEPAKGVDLKVEVRKRLGSFLERAFRQTIESEVLDRYTTYTLAKIKGSEFTDGMKKGAAAIICSPRFLFRYETATKDTEAYELASRLSFFLWGSTPDTDLLALAKSGELSKPDVLNRTIDRMLADPKIERFLDSFPSQWMQLENLFGATPDPKRYPQYNLPGGVPASVQMVLEPLLLFDAVYVENRPIIDLIKPNFAYQSEFLKTWYQGELAPSKKSLEQAASAMRAQDELRATLTRELADLQAKRSTLTATVRERVLTSKQKSNGPVVKPKTDLKPYASWDFDGNLKASISSLDLTAHGKISYVDGSVLLDGAYLESPKLPITLKAKTLEVWCTLKQPTQRGGGVMTIQSKDRFDSIVYGERQPRQWISGSEFHVRTLDFPGATAEGDRAEMLHLVMVYQEDGTTKLYRNGVAYGESYKKESVSFPKGESTVLFGLRHLPEGKNKYLAVLIDKARLYDRALTADEVVLAGEGKTQGVTNQEIADAMTTQEKLESGKLSQAIETAEQALRMLPTVDPKKRLSPEAELRARFNQSLIAQIKSRDFRRVPNDDPRYGGIITTAATLTMTSAPTRTLPIARGSWMIEVIFNDPPPPPPNDVPPLNEDGDDSKLTIREKFAQHRKNPNCAGCHAKIDPLGFSLESFDIVGRWRTKYENNRDVDASGTLFKKHDFNNIVELKEAIVKEEKRFARAFTAHLLRFALARPLTPADTMVVDKIVDKTEPDHFKMKSLLREIILSEPFLRQKQK